MEFEEVIKKRRSIRSFKGEVKDEDLMHILRLAQYAPSAGNLQAYEFIIVRDEKTKKELAKAAFGQNFISEGDVVIVSCANKRRSSLRYGKRGEELYSIQDATLATFIILLSAYERGYGTCWVGAFNENKVSKILNLPSYLRPIAIVPIGIPNESPEMPPRFPLEKIIHFEKFQ